jgi:cell shape-determining protein MreC
MMPVIRRSAAFSYREREQTSARTRLLWVTALVIVVYLADLALGGMLRGYARAAAAVVWSAGTRVERGVARSGLFASRQGLAAQNEALRAELADARARSAAAAAALSENELLRTMAGVAADEPGLTVPVVSSFTASPYGTFFVGAGTQSGVAIDALVLAPDGYAIGRVVEVTAHTALVAQLFAPGTSIEALAGTVPLTLSGEGGGNATARVPRGAAIVQGDVVFAPSVGGRPIGVVGAVSPDITDAHTNVSVRTPANIVTLHYVRIVTL